MIKTHCRTGLKYLCVTTKDDHNAYLGSGKYWRRHLKEHGEDFKTEVLVELPELCLSTFNALCLRESVANDVVESKDWANLCYETGYQTGTLGRKYSKESKLKMSESQRGKQLTDEHRQKIGETLRGKKFSDEHKRKLSEAKRNMSDETKNKMSEAQRGNKKFLGKKHSDETRHKMSEIQRGKKASDEAKRKMSEAQRGKQLTDETKRKQSESMKAFYAKKRADQQSN